MLCHAVIISSTLVAIVKHSVVSRCPNWPPKKAIGPQNGQRSEFHSNIGGERKFSFPRPFMRGKWSHELSWMSVELAPHFDELYTSDLSPFKLIFMLCWPPSMRTTSRYLGLGLNFPLLNHFVPFLRVQLSVQEDKRQLSREKENLLRGKWPLALGHFGYWSSRDQSRERER